MRQNELSELLKRAEEQAALTNEATITAEHILQSEATELVFGFFFFFFFKKIFKEKLIITRIWGFNELLY